MMDVLCNIGILLIGVSILLMLASGGHRAVEWRANRRAWAERDEDRFNGEIDRRDRHRRFRSWELRAVVVLMACVGAIDLVLAYNGAELITTRIRGFFAACHWGVAPGTLCVLAGLTLLSIGWRKFAVLAVGVVLGHLLW